MILTNVRAKQIIPTKKSYISHEVTAPRAASPSGRTIQLKPTGKPVSSTSGGSPTYSLLTLPQLGDHRKIFERRRVTLHFASRGQLP
jgi:hypothetical protein